jgi:hypothetical protein
MSTVYLFVIGSEAVAIVVCHVFIHNERHFKRQMTILDMEIAAIDANVQRLRMITRDRVAETSIYIRGE